MNLLPLLHPASVHFPIALLLLGSALGLVHISGRWPWDLRRTVWILLVAGWVGAAVAVLTGLLAQAPLAPDAPYRGVLNWHIGTGLAQLLLYGFLLYRGWLFTRGKARKRRAATNNPATDLLDDRGARTWLVVVLVTGMAMIVATGWYGGQLVYEFGVNVQL